MKVCDGYRLPLCDVDQLPVDGGLGAAYGAAVEQTLARLGRAAVRPAAIAPFERLFRDSWRVEQITASGRPVVGALCNFVPEQIVLAAGAIPLRLELGLGAAVEAGARVLPIDVCPEIKALVGASLAGLPLFRLADLIVVPTACDGKKKLIQLLSELTGRSDRSRRTELWPLELPQTKDYRRGAPLWREQILALTRRIEHLARRRVRRRALMDATRLLNRRSALLRQLEQLRWSTPGLISGGDVFLAMQASFVADPGWWVEQVEALVAELRQAAATSGEREQRPRIVLAGSPVFFPDYGLLHLIEDAGAEIVGDEMCSGTQRLRHPTVIDEGTVGSLLRAAADHTLLPSTCPCFVSSDDRIEQLLALVHRSRAQGVVHHTLRLCQLYDLELVRLRTILRDRGVPLLDLHADQGHEAGATIKNRVDAFVEMLGLD